MLFKKVFSFILPAAMLQSRQFNVIAISRDGVSDRFPVIYSGEEMTLKI